MKEIQKNKYIFELLLAGKIFFIGALFLLCVAGIFVASSHLGLGDKVFTFVFMLLFGGTFIYTLGKKDEE